MNMFAHKLFAKNMGKLKKAVTNWKKTFPGITDQIESDRNRIWIKQHVLVIKAKLDLTLVAWLLQTNRQTDQQQQTEKWMKSAINISARIPDPVKSLQTFHSDVLQFDKK